MNATRFLSIAVWLGWCAIFLPIGLAVGVAYALWWHYHEPKVVK